jgi:hypothetical protein
MEITTRSGANIILDSKRNETEQGKILFDMIDENKKTWMKVELSDNDSLKILEKSDEIVDDEEIIESKLDDLLSEIIEKQKAGTDTFNEGKPDGINPYNPEEIKVRSDKITIPTINDMIERGEIDLNPDFQRNLVWDHMQKSRLIESILLRIPLPMFYFAEDKEAKLSVIDGLQRISAIKEFMDNKFPLKNLQYLESSCGNRYYKTVGKKQGIDAKYFRWFNLTNLSANFIDPSSPYQVKYDIFKRINTGGKPLNGQEIRNCLAGQGLRDVLKEMATMSEFKSATDNSVNQKRMEDKNIALRFLMLYDKVKQEGNIDSYNGYMDTSLDEFTENNIKKSKEDFKHQIQKYSTAMKNAEYLIGQRYAFRKVLPAHISSGACKQLINKALFVCTSILLADYDNEKIKSLNEKGILLLPLANKIQSDREFLDYLSYGTNGKSNLLYTYSALKELFTEVIKYE